MVICIECNSPIESLYTSYSSENIKLTVCGHCNKFADKYIEHGPVVIFIDLLLLKPQVFRHLVFNLLAPVPHAINHNFLLSHILPQSPDTLHRRVWRLAILITLFDVYLTWARVEKSSPHTGYSTYVLAQPVLLQYFFFLFLCISETVLGHLVIRWLAPRCHKYDQKVITGNTLSTALLISSATKLFPILMVIWSYDIPLAAKVVGWVVNINVVATLAIILNCGYLRAVAITVITVGLQSLVWRKLIIWGLLRNCTVPS